MIRKNGSDGVVTVDWKTKDIDATGQTATAGVDYEEASGTLRFGHGEIEGFITVTIIPKGEDE